MINSVARYMSNRDKMSVHTVVLIRVDLRQFGEEWVVIMIGSYEFSLKETDNYSKK